MLELSAIHDVIPVLCSRSWSMLSSLGPVLELGCEKGYVLPRSTC